MDEAVANATIAAFEPLQMRKPKLSAKLLSKPPFRFLHDVVMNSCAQTGFGDGLYGDDERDAKAIADKAGKIAFLAKALTLTGICAGAPLAMQPSKVVAACLYVSQRSSLCRCVYGTWGPQGQPVRGVKTMVKTVRDRRIALLESYGRR